MLYQFCLKVNLLIQIWAEEDEIEKLKAVDDENAVENQELYLYIPAGYGKSKLDNYSMERKLKVKATTRNWKTVNRLYEMCL